MPLYATYAATKAGIAHLGEALRRELHGEGRVHRHRAAQQGLT